MCRKMNVATLLISASVLSLTCSGLARANIPKPVGLWRFEGNTFDSGGGNHGILKGNPTITTDPLRGKCLQLDGNGCMDIPSGVTELGNADFTIAAWIKTTKIGIPVLSKSNGNSDWEVREKELYIADSDISEADNDGTVEYVGHSCSWIRGDTPADDGQWHHIALTWDADAKEGCVYVDGVESTDDIGFSGGADNAADTVRIGSSESAHTGGNFAGRIDDVAIFDVALSPEQIAELIKLGGGVISKTTPTSTNKDGPPTLDTDPHLVGWWKFDETSGTTAADSSKYGRKGKLQGGLSFSKDSAPGKTGKALKIEGDDELVEITKYKGVTGTKPRTVAAWIKTGSSRGEIISWGTEEFGQMFRYCFIRGRVGITPNGGYLYINDPVHDDKWHHVAAVVVEAELPNLHDDVKLYKDGLPADIHDIGLLDLWPLETGDELNVRIGRRFKGLIDDVRIYDRPLSDDEINALFKLRSNRPLKK